MSEIGSKLKKIIWKCAMSSFQEHLSSKNVNPGLVSGICVSICWPKAVTLSIGVNRLGEKNCLNRMDIVTLGERKEQVHGNVCSAQAGREKACVQEKWAFELSEMYSPTWGRDGSSDLCMFECDISHILHFPVVWFHAYQASHWLWFIFPDFRF